MVNRTSSAKSTARFSFLAVCLVAFVAASSLTLGQTKQMTLDSPDGLKLHNLTAEPVTYQGRKAIRVVVPSEAGDRPVRERQAGGPTPGQGRLAGGPGPGGQEENFAIVQGLEFHDGVIEVDVAGAPREGAGAMARGFIGIAFRMAADEKLTHERIYLRPTNGRADDQERRNHSVQYVSHPDFPWQKLRSETPSKYETYADLVPGEWTKVRIEVKGEKMRLYVKGAEQPTLLVNDLKLGADAKGSVALWVNPATDGYFSNLKIWVE